MQAAYIITFACVFHHIYARSYLCYDDYDGVFSLKKGYIKEIPQRYMSHNNARIKGF